MELGAYMEVRRGPARGRVTLILFGGWYGASDAQLRTTLQPFLNLVRADPVNTDNIRGNGSYIDSVRILGLPYPLAEPTPNRPNHFRNFYVKSLMTPGLRPVTNDSWVAFAKYLAEEGSDTRLVSSFVLFSD